MASVNPDWIPAAITVGGVFAGVTRAVYRSHTKRVARQNLLNEVSDKVYGHPGRADSRGVVYEPAATGLDERTAALENAYANHDEHPPGRAGLVD